MNSVPETTPSEQERCKKFTPAHASAIKSMLDSVADNIRKHGDDPGVNFALGKLLAAEILLSEWAH